MAYSDPEKIKAHIILKLMRRRCWGNKHTPIDSLIKSVCRNHLEGDYRKAMEALIKEGLIIDHAKGYGACSLNPRMKAQLNYIIFQSKILDYKDGE